MKKLLMTTATIAAIGVVTTTTASPAATSTPPSQSAGTIERSFDVGGDGTLRVDADFGSIDVITAASNRVEVNVIREVRNRYSDDEERILSEFEVDISQSGDEVVVTAEVSEDARDRWRDEYNGTPLRVTFEITVPRAHDVELDTAGGNISVDDLDGELRAETSGGNLEFGNIGGPVFGRTAGGNISLDSSSGPAEVHTAGGNITIGNVGGNVDAETAGGSISIARANGDVRADTAGGNITVEEVTGTIDATTSGGNVSATITEQPSGDCRLSTSAGTVTVTLAAGIGMDIDASTSTGGVSSDFSVDGRTSRNSIRGGVNGGGPELRLRTSAGSIRIRER